MEKKRIEWIDYLGGFAMLLVFMQHAKVPLITRMILTFHMPLFFYISGFLFIENKSFEKSFNRFFVGKLKRLLVPWILWMVLSQIVSAPFGLYDGTFDLKKIILSLLKEGLLYCNNLWFLPALFISEVIFYWVSKLINGLTDKSQNFKNHSSSCTIILKVEKIYQIFNKL